MKNRGFTLLEILVALFIFTILALMLASALHNVIGIQDRTEKNADRLRSLQLALLMMSRDIEQAVDRPVISASGGEEKAFIGSSYDMTFTHAGFANPGGAAVHSSFQRARYYIDHGSLWRMVWPVLDQSSKTKGISRVLLDNIASAHFSYLDKDGRFQNNWPPDQGQALPKAVKIELTISNWGTISQLYVIPTQPTKAAPPAPPTPPPPPKS